MVEIFNILYNIFILYFYYRLKYTFLSPTSYVDCIMIWNSIISSYLNEIENFPLNVQQHEFFTNIFLSFLNKILTTKDNFLLQFDNSVNYGGNIITLIDIPSKIETIINDLKNEKISDIKMIKYNDTVTEREYIRNITCELLSLLCQLTIPLCSMIFQLFNTYLNSVNFGEKNGIYEDIITLTDVYKYIIIFFILFYLFLIRFAV